MAVHCVKIETFVSCYVRPDRLLSQNSARLINAFTKLLNGMVNHDISIQVWILASLISLLMIPLVKLQIIGVVLQI